MSQVWKNFERIMSDKELIKTAESVKTESHEDKPAPTSAELSKMFDAQFSKIAANKDPDYDVKVPAAGSDTKSEETGYELVEIAHPEQVQVSNSQLNDGIVENDVEKQKVMMDVALRNPRGVLGNRLANDLMKILVKAANILEEEYTDESLKLAGEIDGLLTKLADGVVSDVAKGVGYGWMLKKIWNAAKGKWQTVKVPAPAPAASAAAPSTFAMESVAPPAAAAAEAPAAGAATAPTGVAAATGRMLTMPLTGMALPASIAAGVLTDALVIDWAVNHNLDNVYDQMTKVASDLEDLDIPKNSKMYAELHEIVGKLNTYSGFKNELAFDTPRNTYMSFQNIEQVHNFINKETPIVHSIIQNADETPLLHYVEVWKASKAQAEDGWNKLVALVDSEYNELKKRLDAAAKKYMAPEAIMKSQPTVVPGKSMVEKPSAGPASMSRGGYSAHGPEVEQLQTALRSAGYVLNIDSKFGPKTFAALKEEAKDDYNLRNYLQEHGILMNGYEHWTNEDVSGALANMKQFHRGPGNASLSVAEPAEAPPPLIPAPTMDTKIPAPTMDTNIRAKQELGSILQQKYPNAEMEGNLIYLNGKGQKPIIKVLENGKWQIIA